ncbi:TerB family tellurite resistance protein [uncultured Desulfosarcina sp.]|uniref:tellurite resistance TerB family protein n=1 Tax=uncultured Desulfosarcina sp. TaxID=218289 RepID=UPI0029C7F680|nr:TerB family tellurite resistance protein [uncultured Desulfosarcina sp.]
MIDLFKRFFSSAAENGGTPAGRDNDRDVIVAVCALFLEMGRIDETFTKQEMAKVLSILTDKYGLSGEDADALLDEADRELKESVDLWQFAKVINDRYSIARKEKLIERLWQIVYVDGKMDQYEHYLMNKVSNLLDISHKRLIDAKLKVLHGN